MSDQEFKTTTIYMLRVSMDKVYDKQEKKNTQGTREMEILINSEKEVLQMKKIYITEMKHAFEGFTSRLDRVEGRLSSLEQVSIECSKTEKQKLKRLKKQNRKPKDCRTTTKSARYT